LTQPQLANELGISVTAIARYEMGVRQPDVSVLYALEQLAKSRDQQDLANVFHSALDTQLGVQVVFDDWRALLNVHAHGSLEMLVLASALEILRAEELEPAREGLIRAIGPGIRQIAHKMKVRDSYNKFVAESLRNGLAFVREDGRVVFRPPTDAEREKYGLKKDGGQKP
jgi:transcriptional regulator with XRE-family HTH domain